MVKRHGEGVQWMQEPLDVEALYRSGEGRKHGRFALLELFRCLFDAALRSYITCHMWNCL